MSKTESSKKDTLEQLKVSDLMSKNIIFVNMDDPLPFVIKLFERTRISGAPVVDKNGKYIGVISKTDLAKVEVLKSLVQNYQNDGPNALTIKHFMNTSPPISVHPDMSIKQASELMVKNNIHRVFVSDKEGDIIGVLSSFDIVKNIAAEGRQSKENNATATA